MIGDIPIDYKNFYKEFDLKIQNLDYSNRNYSLKQRLMIVLREHYLKNRKVYSKIFNEDSAIEIALNSSDNCNSKSFQRDCSAKKQRNSQTGELEDPYFLWEAMKIVDIIPKEYVHDLRKKMFKMAQKSKGAFLSYLCDADIERYGKVQNSYFDIRIATIHFSKDSELGKYITGFEIRIHSLSKSFATMLCTVYINDCWREKINLFCISDRKKYDYYLDIEGMRFRDFRKITKASCPGSTYKEELLDVLLQEIKYRICNIIFDEIVLVNYCMTHKAMSFNIFQTNIDKNSDENFWRSLGIESRFCSYLKKQDACINRFRSNGIDFIYRINKNDQYESRIYAHDVGRDYIEYLNIFGMQQLVEDEITQISYAIQACKNEKFETWIKLKAAVDTRLMYAKRFCQEFVSTGDLCPDDYMTFSGMNIAEESEKCLDKSVEKCLETMENIFLIINSNVEALNCEMSYKIQKTTLYTNLFSAIAALIAIIIAFLSEGSKKQIMELFKDNYVLKYMSYGFVVIFVLIIISNAVSSLISRAKRKSILRKI